MRLRVAWKPPAAGTRWGKIPAWWLDHPELDADGFAVLAALSTFADEQGVCWPSQSTLAAKLKRSRPTINRILQRLDDIGLVTIEHRRGRDGARLSCRYRLRIERDASVSAEPPTPSAMPVQPADRDDSSTNVPCPTASQKQLQSEQNPDSLASQARGPVCSVDPGWTPAAVDRAWATERFSAVDLDRHVEGFVLRCQAHGYRYRDVSAAWRAWLVQDVAAGKAPKANPARDGIDAAVGLGQPAARSSSLLRTTQAEQRVTAWMTVAARLRNAPVPVRSGT